MRAVSIAVSYGSPGIGTSGHLAAELLQQVTGVRMTHAPYASSAQALGDVNGGRLDAAWDYPLTSIPYLREGRLRALAVADTRRVALARDVPTVAEAGVPGAELVSWAGLFVPARTPESIVGRLAGATGEALADPKVRFFSRARRPRSGRRWGRSGCVPSWTPRSPASPG